MDALPGKVLARLPATYRCRHVLAVVCRGIYEKLRGMDHHQSAGLYFQLVDGSPSDYKEYLEGIIRYVNWMEPNSVYCVKDEDPTWFWGEDHMLFYQGRRVCLSRFESWENPIAPYISGKSGKLTAKDLDLFVAFLHWEFPKALEHLNVVTSVPLGKYVRLNKHNWTNQ